MLSRTPRVVRRQFGAASAAQLRTTKKMEFKEVENFLSTPPELIRLSSPLSPDLVPESIWSKSKSIIERSEKIYQIRLRRMELLSLPAHSVSGRNKELMSLAVGAVSGALSLSFHPAFALVFFVSYRMYRKANRPTEERLQSPDKVKILNEEMRTLINLNDDDFRDMRQFLIDNES